MEIGVRKMLETNAMESRGRGTAASSAAWWAVPDEIAARLHAGGSALEIGCGRGLGCLAVAEAFPLLAVTGQDRDAAAIAQARALAEAAGLAGRVRFEVSDSLRLPRASLDFVAAANLLDRDTAPRLLNAIRNALVPDGACLVVEPRRRLGAGTKLFEERVRALAAAAGLSRVRTLACPPSRLQVIELRR
jgi:SAM-dependent methyltransferase